MGKVLVTGANGFVGKVVCSRLLEGGHTPVAGLRDAQQWPGMRAAVPALTTFRVLGDLSCQTRITEALDEVDAVIHLAARVHVMQESASDSLEKFRATNAVGTSRLALAASERNVRRFVFVSTVKVFGKMTSNTPLTENDLCHPPDAYALSKCEGERALRSIAECTGMEVTIVRPPLVYGPGVRANFLRLLRMADLGLPLPIPDTSNRRSFIGVQNLADFLVRCAFHPRAANQTFLVSDGEDLSTRELTAKVGRLLGRKIRFLSVPAAIIRMAGKVTGKENEVSRLLDSLSVDATKGRRLLEWVPPVSLGAELEATARWYRNR